MNRKITGDNWYFMQAPSAINQAMGRVIRHAKDFGAVVLIDERFREQTHLKLLSDWIKNRLKIPGDIKEGLKNLEIFFRSNMDL